MQLKVFYTWPQAIEGFDDPDFGKKIQWDVPLLEGYDWEAVENISKSPSSKRWDGINCPSLNNKVEAYNPDAVMVYGWNLKSHFKAMRYFKGRIPVWFFGDSTLLDEKPGLKKIIRRIWLSWIYRHIDKAFYVGTNNKAYFKAHGVKEDQLVFFPHAIDNDRFFDNDERQYEKKAQKWREKLGYKEDDIVILFAGKLEAKKNPIILLEAVKQLNKATDKQICLLYVGSGPLESVLKEKSNGLKYINFLPFQNQSEMPVVYRLGDTYCLPSKGPGETWGLAVNEGLSCSRPVIVSDKVGCAIDLVQEGYNGFTFKSDNTLHLQNQLKSFLNSECNNLRKQAFETIGRWNFEKKCEAIEKELLIADNAGQ